MEEEIDKQKVKELLVSLENLDIKKVTKENGLLDVRAFNELQKVREVVSKLKEMGVTKEYLLKYFTNAGLILSY